jgi:TldD protein
MAIKASGGDPSIAASAFFDKQFGVTASDLDHALARALATKADYADIYFEYRTHDVVHLEEGLIKQASASTTSGIGVRVLAEAKTGYAFSDDVTIESLESAARTARIIATDSRSQAAVRIPSNSSLEHDLYPIADDYLDVPLGTKVELLKAIDREMRSADSRVTAVMASLSEENKVVLIASSQGWIIGDVQPLVRLDIRCLVESNGNRQAGYFGVGGRTGLKDHLEPENCRAHARKAVRQALVNLEAIEAPAGPMDVVLAPGWPGILLHEAIGHGLEADFNRRRTSAFSGRLGERVATELCTVVDDGTIPSRRGSLNLDDEGTSTRQTVLIEKGILRSYLQDRLSASLMNMELTGNGRRESYAHIPMPRMTNTFMLAGEDDPEDVIRSVEKGVYAVSFRGGQVDITNGKFVFSASEAYLIEGGRITRPLKGVTLAGNGPDVLTRVSRVGADLRLDEGIGTCTKNGQSVPVGVGLPTMRIDQLVVGGTAATR